MEYYKLRTTTENKLWKKYFVYAERFLENDKEIKFSTAYKNGKIKHLQIQALNNDGYLIKEETAFQKENFMGKGYIDSFKSLYLRIWQDALYNIRKHNPGDYKWMSLVFISMGNALNILSLFLLLHLTVGTPVLLFQYCSVEFFGIQPIDSFLKFFIQFLLLPLLLNYYFIFYRKKYISLLKSIKQQHRGRLFASYMVASIIVFVLMMAISYMMI